MNRLTLCIAMLTLLLASGCSSKTKALTECDPILIAPPVPADMLARVLADPVDVPRTTEPGHPLEAPWRRFGESLGEMLVSAAKTSEAPPSPVTVVLFTADWCTWCRPAKEKGVPWLASRGYRVEIMDVTRPSTKRGMPAAPQKLPTWVFLRDGREVFRQEGGYLPEHLAKAVEHVPPTSIPAVGGFFGPTLHVADALRLVAGMTLKLGSAATITVPSDLKWTVSQKPGSVVLSFDPSPQVTVHKILNWRVRLEGIEITPSSLTLQIDNLPDVTVKFDWSPPAKTEHATDQLPPDHSTAVTPARRDRPFCRFVGRAVLFTYRVCSIATFVMMLV